MPVRGAATTDEREFTRCAECGIPFLDHEPTRPTVIVCDACLECMIAVDDPELVRSVDGGESQDG